MYLRGNKFTLTLVNCNGAKILIEGPMEFIAPQAGGYFTKVAKPKITMDNRKLSFKNVYYQSDLPFSKAMALSKLFTGNF